MPAAGDVFWERAEGGLAEIMLAAQIVDELQPVVGFDSRPAGRIVAAYLGCPAIVGERRGEVEKNSNANKHWRLPNLAGQYLSLHLPKYEPQLEHVMCKNSLQANFRYASCAKK